MKLLACLLSTNAVFANGDDYIEASPGYKFEWKVAPPTGLGTPQFWTGHCRNACKLDYGKSGKCENECGENGYCCTSYRPSHHNGACIQEQIDVLYKHYRNSGMGGYTPHLCMVPSGKVDIDECANGTHTCDKNKFCNNSDGSYSCDDTITDPSARLWYLIDQLNDNVAEFGNKRSKKQIPKRMKKIATRMDENFQRRVKIYNCDPTTPIANNDDETDLDRTMPPGCVGNAKEVQTIYKELMRWTETYNNCGDKWGDLWKTDFSKNHKGRLREVRITAYVGMGCTVKRPEKHDNEYCLPGTPCNKQ